MFCLTVTFGNAGTTWALLFKTLGAAESAYARFDVMHLQHHAATPIAVEDDFGQRVRIPGNEVKGLMLDDMSQSQAARIEMGLYQQKTVARGNKLAQTDPELRHSAQGPAVLTPGMNGPYRPM